MFVIESHIPFPEKRLYKKISDEQLQLPWSGMKAGDSFFVPVDGGDPIRLINKITGSAHSYFGPGKVSARTTVENGELGVRAWLIESPLDTDV